MSQTMPTELKWSRFFDGHTHLPIKPGVLPQKMIINGTRTEELAALRQESLIPNRLVGFGIHPWFVSSVENLPDIEIYAEFAFVGEIGLDRSVRHRSNYETQVQCVQRQLDIASLLNKNVCFHLVKAYADTYKILQEYHGSVFFHGYRGSLEFANSLKTDLCFFGFSAKQLKTRKGAYIASHLPLNRIILETDTSPCLGLIKEAYQILSHLKKVSIEHIHKHQKQNLEDWLSYSRSC